MSETGVRAANADGEASSPLREHAVWQRRTKAPEAPASGGAFLTVFQEAEADEAFGGGHNGLFVGAGIPAQQAAGFFVGGVLRFA